MENLMIIIEIKIRLLGNKSNYSSSSFNIIIILLICLNSNVVNEDDFLFAILKISQTLLNDNNR